MSQLGEEVFNHSTPLCWSISKEIHFLVRVYTNFKTTKHSSIFGISKNLGQLDSNSIGVT